MSAERKGLYIPRVVLYDTQLSSSMKLVYAAMIEAAEDGICRLSSAEIGERSGLTAAAALANRHNLCRCGYVQLVPHTNHNYQLLKIKRKERGNG